jgi:hypothetical protein
MAKVITLTGIGRAAGGKTGTGTILFGVGVLGVAGWLGYWLWKRHKAATQVSGIGAQPPLYLGDHNEKIKAAWWARQRELEYQRAYQG